MDLLFDIDRLKIYYEKAFPYDLMFRWMAYDKFENKTLRSLDDGTESGYFNRREFSFTLENDVYCRYQSFNSAKEFKEALVTKVPFKIDMGAVFNQPPKNQHTTTIIPIEKEMVFDIDMTDYDNVRTCCEGAKVCQLCWEFMVLATKVINESLI